MNTLRLLFLCVAFGMTSSNLIGQNWSEWQEIYSGVYISFKISTCTSQGLIGYSFYRTKVDFPRDQSWLYGSFNYVDCDEKVNEAPFIVDLSKAIIDDNRGQWFMGKYVYSPSVVRVDDPNEEKKKLAEEKERQEQEENQANHDASEKLIQEGDALYYNGDNFAALNKYEEAQYLNLNDSDREKLNGRISRTKSAIEEKESEEKQKKEQDEKEEKERIQNETSQNSSSGYTTQKDFLQETRDRNNANQQARNEVLSEESAALAAGTTAAAGLIFFHIGPEYDRESNIYKKGRRINLTVGLGVLQMPSYSNDSSIFVSGTGTNTFLEVTNNYEILIAMHLGIQYWPFFSKSFGLGLTAEGTGGYLPLSGGYSYGYDYALGMKTFLGSQTIKILLGLESGDRGLMSSSTYSQDLSEFNNSTEGATNFVRYQGGICIGFDTKSSIRNIEITYCHETYPNMPNIKGNGAGINIYAFNRIGIKIDYLYEVARIGLLDYKPNSDVTNTGYMWRITIRRTMDWFKGKNK